VLNPKNTSVNKQTEQQYVVNSVKDLLYESDDFREDVPDKEDFNVDISKQNIESRPPSFTDKRSVIDKHLVILDSDKSRSSSSQEKIFRNDKSLNNNSSDAEKDRENSKNISAKKPVDYKNQTKQERDNIKKTLIKDYNLPKGLSGKDGDRNKLKKTKKGYNRTIIVES